MMRKTLSFILAICLIFTLIPYSFAASEEANEAADRLHLLGLFGGTGTNPDGTPIYDLDREPSRLEAIVMLVRLLGKETEAKEGIWAMPFTDVPEWAASYVSYAYAERLTSGTSENTFGSNDIITASQYLTFVLRALGYESGVDFQWDQAWEFTDELGITSGEYDASSTFLRGDIALVSVSALSAELKDEPITLADKLIDEGVFTQEQYDDDTPLILVPTEEPTETQTGSSLVRGKDPNRTVYVSNRSNTIHSVHDCSGMKNYREMTLGEAEAKGYKYCTNCW